MNTSLFEQELAPLNAQIEQTRKKREVLDEALRVIEAELETFSAERQRFDALRTVCDALDKLGEMQAANLFWEGIPEFKETAGHMEQVRSRIARFESEISGILEKQASVQAKINERLEELDYLYEEVRDAHDREERRKEEFVLEREISTIPFRAMVMPWTKEAESEKHFRRAVLVALLICLMFGSIIQMVKVPIQVRSADEVEIPERLAMLVKKEPPKPAPIPKPEPKKVEDETKPSPKPEVTPEQPAKKSDGPAEPVRVAGGGSGGGGDARKKAESVGVLAFKNTLADLMDETPVARIGLEARLSKDNAQPAGQAVAQRSLVAMQAKGGTSGGISNYGFSRNIGSGNGGGGGGFGIGKGGGGGDGDGTGVGFVRRESAIASKGEAPRPLSDGPGAGRTDEEIQIVFDRYKAALYRIYNTELRKDPTLRGKILLRISIEMGGEVSSCKVESTDLNSPALVAQVVERIMRFNFGPKDGVPKTTILYPIDFLPAG